MITVKVPATTANLGPGFDCLGMALSLYNRVSFEEEGLGLKIEGCIEKYANEKNLAYVGYVRTLESKGIQEPNGLHICIEGDVPISRGLGSSATLIVAGIMAANEIHGLDLSKEDMLLIANGIEGHPDNVSPAIFGGLTASLVADNRPLVMKYDVSDELRFTALIPDFETSTEEARALLPEMIKRTDGVFTAGRLAILLKALENGDEEVLRYALDDKLHQPYRKALIPGFDDIREAAISFGAAGLIISGSGSTLLAVGGKEGFKDDISLYLKDIPGNWAILDLSVDRKGATIA